MCPSPDKAREQLIFLEKKAKILGFCAAKNLLDKSNNPYAPFVEQSQLKAWEDGWNSYHAKMLPNEVENLYLETHNIKSVQESQDLFKEKKELTPELEQILDNYK